MNYDILPSWDTNMAIAFRLGTITPDFAGNGLYYDGVTLTPGAPAATPGRWIPGATVRTVNGRLYINQGSVALPQWHQVQTF